MLVDTESGGNGSDAAIYVGQQPFDGGRTVAGDCSLHADNGGGVDVGRARLSLFVIVKRLGLSVVQDELVKWVKVEIDTR